MVHHEDVVRNRIREMHVIGVPITIGVSGSGGAMVAYTQLHCVVIEFTTLTAFACASMVHLAVPFFSEAFLTAIDLAIHSFLFWCNVLLLPSPPVRCAFMHRECLTTLIDIATPRQRIQLMLGGI